MNTNVKLRLTSAFSTKNDKEKSECYIHSKIDLQRTTYNSTTLNCKVTVQVPRSRETP